MIQNQKNNLVYVAIFLLYNKMLSGHKKVKMVLGMKSQDKTKSERCEYAMQKIYNGEGSIVIKEKACILEHVQYGHFPNAMQVKPLSLPHFSCILKE